MPEPERAQRGVLTIAHGDQKYIEQAKALARSIRIHSSDVPVALATDTDTTSGGLFDAVTRRDFSQLDPLLSKLRMYEFSPFEQTLFIDADSLVVAPLEPVFEAFDGKRFSVFGAAEYTTPDWFHDIQAVEEITGSDGLPGFNGGIYYFEKPGAEKIFESAEDLTSSYHKLRIGSFGVEGQKGEEPLLSIAMAQEGIRGVGRNEAGFDIMYAPAGRRGKIEIDVLEGICRFNKKGTWVEPTVMHFASDDNCYCYKREQLRLAAHDKYNALGSVTSLSIELRARWHHFGHHFLPIWSRILRNKVDDIWNG